MSNGLEKLVGGVGKAIEVVPDIYDDGLKPTAQESGKTLALIPRTINAALVPLRQWIAEREYKLAETEKLIAQRLADIPPERIVTLPNDHLAAYITYFNFFCFGRSGFRFVFFLHGHYLRP